MPAFTVIIPHADEGAHFEQVAAAAKFAPVDTFEIIALEYPGSAPTATCLAASIPVTRLATSRPDDPAVFRQTVAASRGEWLVWLTIGAKFDFQQIIEQVMALQALGASAGPFANSGPLQLPLSAGGFRTAEELLVFCALHQLAPLVPLMVRRTFLQKLWPAQPPAIQSLATTEPLARLRAGTGSGQVLSGPESVQIGPTNLCNARCLFCYSHSPLVAHPKPTTAEPSSRQMLDYEAWMRCLNDLADLRVKYVDYIGLGEPLAHPRIDDALQATHGRFERIRLYSNGILLKSHAGAVSRWVDSLTVSLNAATSATHSHLHTTAPGSFERVLDGIAAVQSQGGCRDGIHLSFVVNKRNFREIPVLNALCRQLNVKVGLTPLGVYPETEAALGFTPAEREELFALLKMIEQQPDHRIANLVQYREFYDRNMTCVIQRIPCYVGYIFAQIRGDGRVAFCCAGNATVGNIHENSFRDLWFSAPYNRLRQRALTQMIPTGHPLPGCNCNICGFALESVRVFNLIHQTELTFEKLKRAAASSRPLPTATPIHA